jgi:hypothetical protein
MKQMRSLFIPLVVCVLVISCSKSNEEDLTNNQGNNGGNNNTCDTTNMSFVTDIKPIIQSNCYSCHSNANYTVSGIKLEDYADLKHHTDDGDLIGVITHAAGYPAMPQGAAKLSDCNINKIKAWVEAGALEN